MNNDKVYFTRTTTQHNTIMSTYRSKSLVRFMMNTSVNRATTGLEKNTKEQFKHLTSHLKKAPNMVSYTEMVSPEDLLSQFEAESVHVPDWHTTNAGPNTRPGPNISRPNPVPMSSYGGAGVDEPINKMMSTRGNVEIKRMYIEEDEVGLYEQMGYTVHEDVDFDDEGSMSTVYSIFVNK